MSADESTDYETLLLSQAKFAVMRLVKHECKEENGDGGQQQTDVVGAEQNGKHTKIFNFRKMCYFIVLTLKNYC